MPSIWFRVELGNLARKGRESLALATFLGLYVGVLGIYFDPYGQQRPVLSHTE